LELVLEIPIERVEVSREKSIVYNPEYKGVRLDVYAKDENHTHYNIEMQVRNQRLEKRSRYYHSQMDMELLLSGVEYEELPDTYVVFICDYDPFGAGKYRYTLQQYLKEAPGVNYTDGAHSVFLSTRGKNADQVPEGLVKFLQYVHADLSGSTKDFEDGFVRKLQSAVANIKASREMGARYMTVEEWIKEERADAKAEGMAEGKLEGIAETTLELLEDLGTPSESLRQQIFAITDLQILKKLHSKAAKIQSLEEFEAFLDSIKL
jgi:predicted transposase/invertase (TIGR01784 family)